ncbi:MAG: glycosyltransferase family 2 protein [Rhodococcus sp. (in: high G+C Gram-positive bacteria)]
MTPRISVIMVTYNSAHVVADSLTPLVGLDDIDIVVRDNASTDTTCDLVARSFPDVVLLRGDDNVGFARGVNAAALEAHGAVLVLLNPDAVVAPETLRRLADHAEHGRVVAGPLIRHPDGLIAVGSAGRFPTAWRMLTHYCGLSRLGLGAAFDGHYTLLSRLPADAVVDVDWVTGACLAVGRETWDQLGGLSERWFMYAEDVDLCWRVVHAGGRCVLDTGADATHLVGGSDSTTVSRTTTSTPNSMWVTNLYDFVALRMCHGRIARVWWGVVVGLGLRLRAIVFRVQARLDNGHRRERAVAAADFDAHSRAVLRAAVVHARTRGSALEAV